MIEDWGSLFTGNKMALSRCVGSSWASGKQLDGYYIYEWIGVGRYRSSSYRSPALLMGRSRDNSAGAGDVGGEEIDDRGSVFVTRLLWGGIFPALLSVFGEGEM